MGLAHCARLHVALSFEKNFHGEIELERLGRFARLSGDIYVQSHKEFPQTYLLIAKTVKKMFQRKAV